MYFSPSMSGTSLAIEIYRARVQMYEADIDATVMAGPQQWGGA